MKQFLNALFGLLLDILELIATLVQYFWRAFKSLIRWLIPIAKSANTKAQQKLKEEWEALPDQIEKVRTTAQEKAAQLRENMPEHKEKLKAMAQQGMKTAAEGSQWVKETFYNSADTLHRNVDQLKESIDDTKPEPHLAKIIDVPFAKRQYTQEKETGEKQATAREFKFQKKHLWVIIGICAIIGAVSTSQKSKSKHSTQATQPTTQQPTMFHSPAGFYNSPGVAPPPSSNTPAAPSMEQLRIQTEENQRINEEMKNEYAERREAEKARKEAEALSDAMAKQKQRELENQRIKRMASNSGYTLDSKP